MGVAFQNGTVHECAGVAFVGVAADVFLIGFIGCRKGPFPAGGEACATTAAETGSKHHVDDLLRGHFSEDFAQRLIAVHGDVLVDIFGVDDAAVPESDPVLLGIELGLVQGFDPVGILGNGLLIEQMLDHTAFEQVLADDLRDIFRLYFGIEGAFGVNDHEGAQSTQAEAAGLDDLYFVFQAVCFQLGIQGVDDLLAVGGGTSGAPADQYVRTIHVAASLFHISAANGVLGDDLAVHQVVGHNFSGFFRGHFDVSGFGPIGVKNLDDGLILTDADTAGLGDGNIFQAVFLNLFDESGEDGTGSGGDAAGGHADDNVGLVRIVLTQMDTSLYTVTDSLQLFQALHKDLPFF